MFFKMFHTFQQIKQSTSGKRRYQLNLLYVRQKQFGELWSINEQMTLAFDLEIQQGCRGKR